MDYSRSPHGERGLKFAPEKLDIIKLTSLPPRGAWIEIPKYLEIALYFSSLPPRGAWIEILHFLARMLSSLVAPLTGSVD